MDQSIAELRRVSHNMMPEALIKFGLVEAKNVLIQLVREGTRFNLTVEDDGKGFDINENKDGAGLTNIKARAEYLNGSVDIVSKKGDGTSVNIEGEAS